MPVISKSAESNAVSSYFVTALAGPRIGKVRVEKGEELRMTEHQARALLASGALVADKAMVDDPFGEAAAADKAAAEEDAARKKAEAEAAQKAVEQLGDQHHETDHPGEHAGDHHADDHAAG